MDKDKLLHLQMQVKQNSEEMRDYLNDLNSWEDEIKIKEESLKGEKSVTKSLPPIRNRIKKKKSAKNESNKDVFKVKRIKSCDYKAWDKFDADKECEVVDRTQDSESENDAEEEFHEDFSTKLREQGNQYFKEGKYKDAIGAYTMGLTVDASDPVLLSNRAMAYIKTEKYELAEDDCTASLRLNPYYAKTFMRRGSARQYLKKYKEAREDFIQVLALEPQNTFSRDSLENINKIIASAENSKETVAVALEKGIVRPISKPPNERSKKPLRRIAIEEVGVDPLPLPRAGQKESIEDKRFQKFLGEVQKNDSEKCKTSEKLNETATRHDKANVPTMAECHHVPSAPVNSYQFQNDWRTLRNKDTQFFQYFKTIDPNTYKQVFGESFDSYILSKIISVLHQNYSEIDSYTVLKQLANVRRFSMNVGFLSSIDKQRLNNIFENLSQCKEDIKTLRSLYI